MIEHFFFDKSEAKKKCIAAKKTFFTYREKQEEKYKHVAEKKSWYIAPYTRLVLTSRHLYTRFKGSNTTHKVLLTHHHHHPN